MFTRLQTAADVKVWRVCVDRVGGEVDTAVLTVEFSVRLVRTGKSLLMVQVSVREPCSGWRE